MYCNYRGNSEYFLYKKQIDEYRSYEENNLPEWYRGLSFHDNNIINVEYDEGKLVLTLNYDLPKTTSYKICFYDYEIIESCNLINAWILADELYLEQENNEFHLLVDCPVIDSCVEHDYQRAYFTIRFKKMEMIFNDLICTLGDGVDELHNPVSTDEIYRALYNEPKWYRKLLLYNTQIIKIEKTENKLNLTLIYNVKSKFKFKICFYNYKENNNIDFLNYYIIDDALYYEYNELYFALVEYDNGLSKNFRIFDIEFSRMEIIIDDLVYSVGKDVDEFKNPSVEDLEQLLNS